MDEPIQDFSQKAPIETVKQGLSDTWDVLQSWMISVSEVVQQKLMSLA